MKISNFEITPLIELILKAEIAQGNRIVESNKGWPEKESTLIILKMPFYNKFNIENLEYRDINDPHYWKEEYYDESNKQTIACRF